MELPKHTQRRDFLKTAAVMSGSLLLPAVRCTSQATDSRIEVFPTQELGSISHNVYGHFTEHIGGVIYDGVWVGENSKIPNTYGIRTALLDRLKEIHAPIIRWPGGCFADSYDWRDGIGPAAQRPARTNFWETEPDARRLGEKGRQIFDDNSFGTNEFVRFCRLSGAEPYIAANLRSLSALDFDHWVEYCNSPAGSTAFAKVRAEAGFPEPFHVRYWGIGNESWGCGGNFRPEEYASEFRRFTTWVPEYDQDLQFIGSGPNNNDLDWTRGFFEELLGRRPYHVRQFTGWSVHHYSRTQGKRDALSFSTDEYYQLLQDAAFTERILQDQWAVMGEYDPNRRIKLVVDEYGPWHHAGTEVDPTHIFGQQITMRDAIATALTLDIFNRHPEKVSLAACAQLVNNLNALFLAHEDKFVATPNFHVFKMYAAHQDATAVGVAFSAPNIAYNANGKRARFWGLNGSASLQGKDLTLTVVNPHIGTPCDTEIVLRGARYADTAAAVLTSEKMNAHNTFEQPDTVAPQSKTLQASANPLRFSFPPASVTKLQIRMA
ncbi:MAG: alpha-L-arabinofuranosidase [Acidobacteriaceae bacterium]|nr:alpha-L-arabinofuranosidase [Acidobacteriaceae bacterium]